MDEVDDLRRRIAEAEGRLADRRAESERAKAWLARPLPRRMLVAVSFAAAFVLGAFVVRREQRAELLAEAVRQTEEETTRAARQADFAVQTETCQHLVNIVRRERDACLEWAKPQEGSR